MRVRDVTSWQGRGSRKRPWTAINFEERLWWNCSTLMYTEHTKFYKHEDGKQRKSPLPFYDSGTTALLILMALLQIGLQCWQLIVYFRFYKTGFSLFCFKWKLSAFIACFNTSARSHILLLPSPLLNMHTEFSFCRLPTDKAFDVCRNPAERRLSRDVCSRCLFLRAGESTTSSKFLPPCLNSYSAC